MKLTNLIKIALGIAILLLLIWKAGISEIASTLKTANPIYIPLIAALFTLGLWMGAYNLKILTDAINTRISMKEMWNYYLTSWAFGMIIPGKIGELSFVYLARKHLTIGQGTAVAVLDKIITIISLCALAFFGLFIFFPFNTAIKLTAATTIGGIFGIAFIFSGVGRKLIRKALGKFGEKFSGFSKTLFFLVLNRKKEVTINFAITLLKWGLTAIVTYFAFLAFGQSISPLTILTISATTMLISLIPITMSGLGIKEGAAAFLYGQLGIPIAVTIAAHIILLLLNYIGAAIVFLTVKTERS